MNSEELQKALREFRECCDIKTILYGNMYDSLDDWKQAILACCSDINNQLEDAIDELTEWAAEYSATWEDYECQLEDNEVIDFDIVFENYLCQQEDDTTTTTSTTSTTINPDLVEFEIVFEDYLCQMEDDPNVTTTAPYKVVEWEAVWDEFLCEMEDNPDVTTTTTTFSGTTTTSTTVDPEDVTFTGTWDDFLCEMEDNPLLTTTTTTRAPIDEDDIDWQIVFEDYLCQQEVEATTTTTTVAGTTTTTPAATTTTTSSGVCGVTEYSGETAFPKVFHINVGATTGNVKLNIDTVSAPDKFIVEWNGSQVINTGYRGDSGFQSALYNALVLQGAAPEIILGAATGEWSFAKTTADPIVTVRVYAPLEETEWSFTLTCPDGTMTTTTTAGTAFAASWSNYLCELEEDGTGTTTTSSTTTTLATTTTTTFGYETVSCGQEQTGGMAWPKVYVVELGASTGPVHLIYDSVSIPDKFVVDFEGAEVINTGYVGDSGLQTELNAALAGRGVAAATINGAASGVAVFAKNTATTLAVVKVWAPMAETEWSFTLTCPGNTTTTTTTAAPTTTTTTLATTTTTTGATTTTTTNAPPVSTDGSINNDRYTEGCGTPIELTPSYFGYTDTEGDALLSVKINSYALSGAGTLTYNGIAVTDGQVLTVIGGVFGSFLYDLVYTPDATLQDAYDDTIDFTVRTANNTNYG